MKFFLFLFLIQFMGLGCYGILSEMNLLGSIAKGASSAASTIIKYTKDTAVAQLATPSHCVEPPKVCPNENVTFWYYTRSKPDSPVELKVTNPETFKNLEKNEHPWKIIIHGYTKSKNEIPNPELRSAYFKRGDYNLISVDYAPLAKDKCYIQAVNNAPLIANCTAQMIDSLIEKNFFKAENLHVVGFSLGGQIAGLIHSYMKNKKPNRVTGLDPAAPLFDGAVNEKLSENSGDFVDVIHTNALVKGKLEASGHVDFYVNGGLNQPGCLADKTESLSTCSHNRSPMYYAESINSPDGFWGIPCTTYLKFYGGLCNTDDSKLVQMGEFTPFTARGSYYLQTRSQEPFALGKLTRVTESRRRRRRNVFFF